MFLGLASVMESFVQRKGQESWSTLCPLERALKLVAADAPQW